jgi:hypothetical protein
MRAQRQQPEPAPYAEAPVQPPPQQPPAAAQDLLAQAVRDSMQAQAQMMNRLAQEMRDMSARTASRPQYIPTPMPPPMQEQAPPAFPRYQPPPPAYPSVSPPTFLEEPIAPPPLEPEVGIPRFARDFAEGEEQAGPLAFEQAVETAKPTETPARAKPDGHPALEAEPVEEKKDLRQRLRDFLKRIRERLEQRRSKPEEVAARPIGAPPAQAERPKKPRAKKYRGGPASAAGPSEGSASLVNYLEELTEYLPDKRKSSFLHSDARLKIEYIKSKLQGRSGIKNQIESRYAPRVEGAAKGKADSTMGGSSLDMGKIAETFDFMKNLASYHPDKTLATMLQSKLNAVLNKIRE